MPIKRPIFRYCVLTCLFAITVAYEIPYLRDVLRGEGRSVAFFGIESGTDHVSTASKEASEAGIHRGDEVISIDGQPYRGLADWARPLAGKSIGSTIAVGLRPADPSAGPEHIVLLPVEAVPVDPWKVAASLTLYFLLPAMCVLLGFWVAFTRPRDPMAWLLLALMLTFPHIFESYKAEAWPRGWREAAMFYHTALGSMLPLVMFLFGRLFPEPFPASSWWDKGWKIMQWLLAIPFTVFALIAALESVIDLGNYHRAAAIRHVTHPLDGVMQVVVYLLIGSFFAAMGTKYGMSKSPDARRRLRILYWGATAAWTPGLLITIYPRLTGRTVADLFPQWLILAALVPLILFPLTLAYVIVVQKAMDVGVALRQGLQYALAKNGVRVVQIMAVAAVISAAVTLASHEGHNRPQKIAVIALGITAVFTIRRVGDRFRSWIDRRFFREAYDADHVLAELSEQVRTMMEPKSLLETVSARISETLHVPQVAVLLGGGAYRPAYAMGYGAVPDVTFPPVAGTIKVLQRQKEPARVYLNDRDSWLYLDTEVMEEERHKLAQLGSELLLPLAVRDKLLGFISLGPKRSEEPYTGTDVRLLKSVAAQTGLALENANLMREIADEVAQRERLNREVEIAREVQERLFPQTLPAIAGLDYAGHCRPALGVGGDYYDFLALPQGQLGVAIGDVSGKGIAAALMMASLQASLRGEATRAPENLAAAVSNINRLVYEASSANRYATFFYGQYDPATHQLHYVNAGHNPPILFRGNNGTWSVTRLDTGGTVVGLLPSFPYQQGSVSVCEGDILLAYTDGISEAMNAADEEWGEDQLMRTIEDCQGLRAQQILQRVFDAADAFVAGAKQHDDMTLVVLCVGPLSVSENAA
ncbi:MAG TPA: SpoIIE family protein phosphatase [Terriglobales bacterium]|nr:SpoIIE family protein phosphatase [Terriglobales bacterium]